jgi:hypothetical protein
MYMGVVWEIVNSISLVYTCDSSSYFYNNTLILMYSYVLRWIAIHLRRHGLNESVMTRYRRSAPSTQCERQRRTFR